MKYTEKGLEDEIEKIVTRMEATAKEARNSLSEKNNSKIVRLSSAMALISMTCLCVSMNTDILKDLTEWADDLKKKENEKSKPSSDFKFPTVNGEERA